jgi:hypothetical protein
MKEHTILSLLHVLLFGPLLIYIGAGMPWFSIPAYVIVGLGVFIILFHAYKAYGVFTAGGTPWVNLIHVLLVGPALLAYGLGGPGYVGELLIMLGFAAVGYHGYYLLV